MTKETIEQRVIRFNHDHNLISSRDKVVVAVSGGSDSVCLLHILAQWREELGINLHVAHLNHQLRASDSEADAKYVSDLARRLNIAITSESRNVTAYREQKRCSWEEAAREVRYSFLSEVAKAIGASKIAVGHTRDDHIETILLHLIRGTGISGLRGLQPLTLLEYGRDAEQLAIVRPLLEITRQETETYCQQYQLKPRTDSSNMSLSFLRNRIRLKLLPSLKDYNPKIDKALLRLASVAADDVSFIEEQSLKQWNKLASEEDSVICLNKLKTAGLPRAIQRQIFRLATAQVLGNTKDIEAKHIEAMISLLSKPAGKRLFLPRGLIISTEYDRLTLGSTQSSLCPLPSLENEFNIKVPGVTILPGWQVKTAILQERIDHRDNFASSLDLDKAGKKLTVRQRKTGDRFQPLGMSQPKKIQDFMVDSRIPRDWRERVPLVCSSTQILWLVGWRIDDRVKVTESTKNILYMKFERLV